jgi:hypothetical protein
MFSQILPLIDRKDFNEAVAATGAARHNRGFSCWNHCVSLLFCQLGRAYSLREICLGLASCEGRLQHLGVEDSPKRSTLSYANEHRPWQMYQELFYRTQARLGQDLRQAGHRHRLRFKNKLLSLDATVIDLSLSLFDWAHFRRTKGAIKLHVMLDHDGYLPCFLVVTEGKTYETTVARQLKLQPGTILVFDRGYNAYAWFHSLCEQGVFFVTRMKSHTTYRVVEERRPPQGSRVLSDEVIELTGRAAKKCPDRLRRVVVEIPDGKPLVFMTNQLEFGATTIAAIYKERWQIELFFKAIKQNLKIKTFLGTTPNAVQTQIWSAMLAMLLVKYLQLKARFGWSLSNLLALLHMSLFVYRDLWGWLNAPWTAPPEAPPAEQLKLALL